jgi:hypothetical protein
MSTFFLGQDGVYEARPGERPTLISHPIRSDQMFAVGGKLYRWCGHCENLVRVNKPLLGGLHFCLTDEEIAAKTTG